MDLANDWYHYAREELERGRTKSATVGALIGILVELRGIKNSMATLNNNAVEMTPGVEPKD